MFFEKAVSEDKEYKKWEGMYHEIMNEDKGGEVVQFLIDWVDKRL